MRRAIARGRMLPQSLSTDPRLGRLSLKAALLFPLMWVNCDDQGRLPGDPDEIKYAACPNIDHITKGDIPALLKELETEGMLKVYTTSKTKAIQMLDWWDVQKLQWAYPSGYPPPEGWQDRLRFHASPTEIVTENWPSKLPNSLPKELPNALGKERGKKTKSAQSPLPSPPEKKKEEKERGNRRGRGNLPSALGSRAPPSLTDLSLFESLKDTFPKAFGKKPDSRQIAQLRDLGKEISSAGGATAEQVYDAFKEACDQNIFSVCYVRKILLAWLGVPRAPP